MLVLVYMVWGRLSIGWGDKLSFIGVTAEDINQPVILSERSESKDLRTRIVLKGIESA